MFSLFFGISCADGSHFSNSYLIGKHRIMGHPFKMNHTVAENMNLLVVKIWIFCLSLRLYFPFLYPIVVHIHYLRVIFLRGGLGHFQGGGGCFFSSVRVKM